jgi:hypothetical protein
MRDARQKRFILGRQMGAKKKSSSLVATKIGKAYVFTRQEDGIIARLGQF